MTGKATSRAQLAAKLAPAAPPCFATRLQWVEYVKAAAVEKSRFARFSPIVIVAGQAPKFNPQFYFCRSCTHSAEMDAKKLCHPDHLESGTA